MFYNKDCFRNIFVRFFALFIIFFSVNVALSQKNNLNYYIQTALTNSPLLKDYQNQIQLNLIDSARIAAGYKLQVSGNSINNIAPTYKGFGYDEAITNGGQLAELISVSKTIISRSHVDAQYRDLQLQNQTLSNTAKISVQDLKKNITSQYITVYGDLQQLNITKQENDLLNKEEKILKILTQKNVYRQTDYLSFLVTLQQQELTIKQLQIQFDNDFYTLNYLCGINDTTHIDLQTPEINVNILPNISNSVFYKKFEIDSLRSINSKALIDYSYKPKISIYGDGGFNSAFSYEGYKNFGLSAGVSLTVPIYDGKQRQLQYNKITISERTRESYRDFFIKQYSQQIMQLMNQLQQTEGLITDINNELEFSETLINANGKLLETGDAKITDYILAINNYLNTKNLLIQNTIARLQIMNQINYWNQ